MITIITMQSIIELLALAWQLFMGTGSETELVPYSGNALSVAPAMGAELVVFGFRFVISPLHLLLFVAMFLWCFVRSFNYIFPGPEGQDDMRMRMQTEELEGKRNSAISRLNRLADGQRRLQEESDKFADQFNAFHDELAQTGTKVESMQRNLPLLVVPHQPRIVETIDVGIQKMSILSKREGLALSRMEELEKFMMENKNLADIIQEEVECIASFMLIVDSRSTATLQVREESLAHCLDSLAKILDRQTAQAVITIDTETRVKQDLQRMDAEEAELIVSYQELEQKERELAVAPA